MNIYDVAGNLFEWTQEASYNNNVTYTNPTYNTYMLRGGSFNNVASTTPAASREYYYSSITDTRNGFRVSLYLE